jgi:hypothetical protein
MLTVPSGATGEVMTADGNQLDRARVDSGGRGVPGFVRSARRKGERRKGENGTPNHGRSTVDVSAHS